MDRLRRVFMSDVKVYEKNPRIPGRAVEAVAKSIEKYGYNSPIIVDKNLVIICGHVRYYALEKIGYEEVDVLISEMSEQAAKEYRIVDNKTSELASWDLEKLVPEIRKAEGIEDFFPQFPDFQSLLGLDSKEAQYSDEDFDTDDFADEMGERSQSHKDNAIDLTCPYCNNEFKILNYGPLAEKK